MHRFLVDFLCFIFSCRASLWWKIKNKNKKNYTIVKMPSVFMWAPPAGFKPQTTLTHSADYYNSLNSLSLQAPYDTICKQCGKQNYEGQRLNQCVKWSIQIIQIVEGLMRILLKESNKDMHHLRKTSYDTSLGYYVWGTGLCGLFIPGLIWDSAVCSEPRTTRTPWGPRS